MASPLDRRVPVVDSARAMSSPPRLRIGLIGAGKHAARYARHLREDCPDLELIGVARRERAKAAEAARTFGCKPYGTWEELVAADVDAVIAVVPPTLHLDIVRAATRAGRALLLEKPAAPGLRAGRLMLEAVAAHPVPVMVAQTLRYNEAIRALRAARSLIGPVRSLTFTQGFEPSPLDWLDDPRVAGGGMVLHTGIHMFDLVRQLSGLEVEEVTCRTERLHTRHTEDAFAATLRLVGGVLATVCGSRATAGRTGHIEVAGEAGVLVADHVLHRLDLVVGTKAQPIALGEPVATVREVLRDFSGAVRRKAAMPVPLVEGLRAVAIADACYAAACTGAAARVEAV